MQQTFTALLFGMTALTSTAVHAEASVSAAGFAISASSPFGSGSGSFSLLSDVGGTASIAMKGFDGLEGYEWSATSHDGTSTEYEPPFSENHNFGNMDLGFDVRDGYRITSITLTGTVTGVLNPGVPPSGGSPGVATNEFSMGWRFEQGDQSITMGQETLKNVHGDQQLQLSTDVPFEGDFTIAMNNGLSAYAESAVGYWYDGDEAQLFYYHQSHASVKWHDVVLTVQVSPVPEPATYAMLLGGLGVAGFAARRRKV